MGSDESHFNVSLIVRTKLQDSVQTTAFLKKNESRSEIEPRPFCYASKCVIRAVHKTGSWVPLLHTACRQIVTSEADIVQELCGSRGGRPGLSVLTSLLVSVDVKLY